MAFLPMLKTTLKNLFSKPATRLYPFEKREPYKHTHGHIENDLVNCTYCTLCEKKCPTKAIKVVRDPKTWTIEPLRCIACNICVEICPKKTLVMHQTYSACQTTGKKL